MRGPKVKHHVVISGTGRAGTTLLVQLLTVLGMDTGFDSPTSQIFPNCNAGMDRDLRKPEAPYIVKDPRLCDYLEEVVRGGGMVIDHAIVPIRDLYAAAESRREVSRKAGPVSHPDQVPGGLWLTTTPSEQEAVLSRQVYKLLCAIADIRHPAYAAVFSEIRHRSTVPLLEDRVLVGRCRLRGIPGRVPSSLESGTGA